MPPGGTLYVVATPIGNLEDITLRALKTLRAVQLVAAEDTRRTGHLLRHFEIQVPILSVHEHNERGRVEKIVSRLAKGESVALVTDAGTPGVSDPGAALVAAIRGAGFRVEPIPGASAVAAAYSASGVSSDGFSFLGFPPIRGKDRKNWFQTLGETVRDRAVVFFEAPHRVSKTLQELSELVDRPIFAARELTKLHEELVWGSPDELLVKFEAAHGEFTFVVPPGQAVGAPAEVLTDEQILNYFGYMTKQMPGSSRREVARRVAEGVGMSTKDVYNALERVKIGQSTN
jgi:16S rRNA (cytidine1402-2'-O)-methyltransferase